MALPDVVYRAVGAEEFFGEDQRVLESLCGSLSQRRHFVGNILVEDLDGVSATGICYTAIVEVEESAQLVSTGVYRFEMRKQERRWLISDALDALDRPL